MYWLLKFSNANEDLFQHLLFEIPRFYAEKTRPPKGYKLEVEKDLRNYLDYVSEVSSSYVYCIKNMLRVYAADDQSGLLVLLVGNEAEKLGVWLENDELVHKSSTVLGPLTEVPEMDWAVMGITFPGWLVIFDETAPHTSRDETGEDFEIVYVPEVEKYKDLFEALTPEKNTEEAASLLLNMVFSSLPLRL